MILIGEASLRRAVGEFIEHHHHERNHQGLDNQLIVPVAIQTHHDGRIRSRERLGGLLKYYHRPAAWRRQTWHKVEGVERLSGLPLDAQEGQVSPDGKWVAYAHAERGEFQIYVQSMTIGGGRSQVSQNGGRQPRWRRDGRELFYLSADGNVTAAEIQAERGFAVTSTRALFDIGATTRLPSNIGFYYDVSSDGQRFVFSTDFYQQIQTSISFVLNWQKLVQGDR